MPLQDAKLRWGPMHANSNVICAIDIRTGGIDPLESDLLEVCFLPLNHSYKPHDEFTLFNLRIRPSFPVNLKYARLNREVFKTDFLESPHDGIKSAELFEYWTERLELKQHKKILPLCWNWAEVKPWLKHWLGLTYDAFIHPESVRDLSTLLNFINDREDYYGNDIPYKQPTFDQLVKRSEVKLFDRNSLTANCLAMSECYRVILHNR